VWQAEQHRSQANHCGVAIEALSLLELLHMKQLISAMLENS
jgi:hypothetical protein